MNTKHNQDKNSEKKFKRAILYSLLTVFVSIPGLMFAYQFRPQWGIKQPGTIQLPYSHLLQAIEQKQIKEVKITPDRSQAFVTTQEEKKVLVRLPNDPTFIDLLNNNQVEIGIVTDSPTLIDYIIAPGIPITIALIGSFLWIWSLVDCAENEEKEGNKKIVWILIIILTSWAGALIYLCIRKPQRLKKLNR